MNHRGWYHYDPRLKALWIVPPKCGSHSFSEHFDFIPYEGQQVHPYQSCFSVLRHPWQRIVSSLTFLELPVTTESALDNLEDQHLRPYSKWINGRDCEIVHLEDMHANFPGYPRLNESGAPSWTKVDIDWSRLLQHYEEDFALCPDKWLLVPAH